MECTSSIPSKKEQTTSHTKHTQSKVFTVMEANLTKDDMPYYQFKGYTIYLLETAHYANNNSK